MTKEPDGRMSTESILIKEFFYDNRLDNRCIEDLINLVSYNTISEVSVTTRSPALFALFVNLIDPWEII